MAAPVARQKGHARAVERPRDDGVGWIAERRLDFDLDHVGQRFHVIHAAAADDGQVDWFGLFSWHSSSPLV